MSFRVGKNEEDSGRSKSKDIPDKQESPLSDGEAMEEDEEEIEVADEGLDAMQAMMGFGGFGSTKDTKVKGNNVGTVRKEKKTEYRQYMNRVGGFNRPLSPGR